MNAVLAHETLGNRASVQRMVFLHGFTQTRSSMFPFISELNAHSTDLCAIAVDAPLHGESQHILTDVAGAADALEQTCGNAIYLGYSMGARMCLHTAVQHPQAVRGLVLISGTAGIVDPVSRQHRKILDNELAEHIEQVGTQQFIHEWLSKPMFALLPQDTADIAQRCTNSPTSLANSLRMCGTGTQGSLWDKLSTLTMPVLLIAGAHDDAFCQHARRMKELIGLHATLEIVHGAGHSVHLEQPQITAQIVSSWLTTF
ncbi:MAG: alpha/beta fold hydrolase [Actinobacteria bacterium]|nr:MAG: alpha/beta fold hydrolase [Actinomycetota bacterium]